MNRHQPRKRFGQHFLHDQGVIQRIIEAIDPRPGDLVVEVGPGEGVLTHRLAGHCQQLHALEIDRDLAASLTEFYAGNSTVNIHLVDALKFDLCSVVANDQRLRVVGNLPYNISTPLLFHFLRHLRCIQDMHFMLQKEVIDRLVAVPGNKHYGRLSVALQMVCETESLFDIGPGAFRPPPKVWSAVVRLRPRGKPLIRLQQVPVLEKLTQQVFSQRRKTLRKSLQGCITPEAMEKIGIDSSRRPETLALDEFAALLPLFAAGTGLSGG